MEKETIETIEKMSIEMQRLQQKCKDLEARITDIEALSDPPRLYHRVDQCYAELNGIEEKLSIIVNRLQIINLDSRFVELFSDDEIRKYYEQSGMSLQDLKTYIDKYILGGDSDISLPTVSRYVNGECTDLLLRSALAKKMRDAAVSATKRG